VSCAMSASSQAIWVDASCGAFSTPPAIVYCPNMLLHPALADSAPRSNVSVMVEPGTMVCAPVTSVATNVMPSNWAAPAAAPEDTAPDAADPEPAEALADPPAEDGLADADAAELPAAGGVLLLLLAHAVRPSSTMAAAPSRVVVRTVVLTTGTHFLISPRSRPAHRVSATTVPHSPMGRIIRVGWLHSATAPRR